MNSDEIITWGTVPFQNDPETETRHKSTLFSVHGLNHLFQADQQTTSPNKPAGTTRSTATGWLSILILNTVHYTTANAANTWFAHCPLQKFLKTFFINWNNSKKLFLIISFIWYSMHVTVTLTWIYFQLPPQPEKTVPCWIPAGQNSETNQTKITH